MGGTFSPLSRTLSVLHLMASNLLIWDWHFCTMGVCELFYHTHIHPSYINIFIYTFSKKKKRKCSPGNTNLCLQSQHKSLIYFRKCEWSDYFVVYNKMMSKNTRALDKGDNLHKNWDETKIYVTKFIVAINKININSVESTRPHWCSYIAYNV